MKTIKERQELRNQLLLELYDHYFKNNGAAYKTTRNELQADKEVDLAYMYLSNKHLINVERQSQNILFQPTASGIDYAESIHPNRNDSNKGEKNTKSVPNNTATAFTQW